MDDLELLRRHNPLLVIFPQVRERRKRPGAWRPGPDGWGDYHPCPAEFFLDHVVQRDEPKGWSARPRELIAGLTSLAWDPSTPTGIDVIRERLHARGAAETARWELDVADLPSQHESRAWREYHRVVSRPRSGFSRVAYGRVVTSGSVKLLQYWYLYVYNDFRNNHEGDWEMVTIELDAAERPAAIAISCHHGGWRRAWSDAPRSEDGERPVVYVARGSHAGYFGYLPAGQFTIAVKPSANPPPFMRPVWGALSLAGRIAPKLRRWRELPGVTRWRDFTAADPLRDAARRPQDLGERIDPALRVMPADPALDSEWWWMHLRSHWGSTHSRVTGTIGPISPWMGSGADLRWSDPLGWSRSVPAG